MPVISVIALGEAARVDAELLAGRAAIELLASPLGRDAEPGEHRPIINRMVDEAAAPWILLLRAGERVSASLAVELLAAAESERAWGYRLPVRAWYGESRLPLRDDRIGPIRFFHRRHARFVENAGAREMKVQGSVVRLSTPLELRVDPRQHAADLAASRRTCGLLLRVTRYLTSLGRSPSALLRSGERRYLWVESAFVHA